MSTTDDNIARAKACGANHFYMTGGSSKFSIALDQLNAYTAQSIADAQRVPMSDEQIDTITREQWGTDHSSLGYLAHRTYARAVLKAHHNIQEVKP